MKNKKIIIFGLGQIFKNRQNQFQWDNVVGVSDNHIQHPLKEHPEIQYIQPSKICQWEYDYVVICAGYGAASEIFDQLCNSCEIPPEKIISDKKYFGEVSWEARSLIEVICQYQIHSLSDPQRYLAQHGVLTMTNVKGKSYAHIQLSYERESNQAIILGKNVLALKDTHKYAYIFMPKSVEAGSTQVIESLKSHEREEVSRLDLNCICFVRKTDVTMYVITHVNFMVPEQEFFSPLWVGDDHSRWIEAYVENGDNIRRLNGKINECTGIYWIWKNTSTKYVGINHYRRYFLDDKTHDIITREQMDKHLKQYDILVAGAVTSGKVSNAENIRESIDEEAFSNAYMLIEKSIEKNQPTYLEPFYNVMHGVVFFPFNMFVMPRYIFNQYCEWLFSIIIPAAEAFDNSGYDSYSQRAVGFFAERLLTVWLSKQKYQIKELPVLLKDTVINTNN